MHDGNAFLELNMIVTAKKFSMIFETHFSVHFVLFLVLYVWR